MNYSALKFFVMFMSVIITTFTFRHFIMVYPFMTELIAENYDVCDHSERNLHFQNMFVVIILAVAFYIIVKFI